MVVYIMQVLLPALGFNTYFVRELVETDSAASRTTFSETEKLMIGEAQDDIVLQNMV